MLRKCPGYCRYIDLHGLPCSRSFYLRIGHSQSLFALLFSSHASCINLDNTQRHTLNRFICGLHLEFAEEVTNSNLRIVPFLRLLYISTDQLLGLLSGLQKSMFLCSREHPFDFQLNHILSKFHCLTHELYLTNHHSSLEHAVYGTPRLLAFLNLTTCHLSYLRSINLILSLSLSS